MTRAADLPAEVVAAMTEWRRDFHRHPELGFQETRTSRLIAERLAGFGLPSDAVDLGRYAFVFGNHR